ncbi:ATP-binding protein [Streptomyces sp. NPDC013171]|uniref:ATP-binding protein n=1 Tax=Streptomyces sp. NPDC013171 TaxID=3364863 RepID=UPI0036A02ADB
MPHRVSPGDRHQPHRQRRHPHPPGTPIRVGVGTAGDRAVLEVADEGPGLTAEDREHVFDRFYRTDDSRARTTGGSGLGPVIAHNGRGAPVAAPGQGSPFRIELPLPNASEPEADGSGRGTVRVTICDGSRRRCAVQRVARRVEDGLDAQPCRAAGDLASPQILPSGSWIGGGSLLVRSRSRMLVVSRSVATSRVGNRWCLLEEVGSCIGGGASGL